MIATVAKQFRFMAAHQLLLVPEDHKCRRLHGHEYMVEIAYRGSINEAGMVVDYADIAAVVGPIIESLDHQNLNDLFDFETTAENLAVWLLKQLDFGEGFHTVRIHETSTTWVEVTK